MAKNQKEFYRKQRETDEAAYKRGYPKAKAKEFEKIERKYPNIKGSESSKIEKYTKETGGSDRGNKAILGAVADAAGFKGAGGVLKGVLKGAGESVAKKAGTVAARKALPSAERKMLTGGKELAAKGKDVAYQPGRAGRIALRKHQIMEETQQAATKKYIKPIEGKGSARQALPNPKKGLQKYNEKKQFDALTSGKNRGGANARRGAKKSPKPKDK